MRDDIERCCKVKVKLTENVEEFNSFIKVMNGKFRLKPSSAGFDIAVDGVLVFSAKTMGHDPLNYKLALAKVSSALVKHTAARLVKKN